MSDSVLNIYQHLDQLGAIVSMPIMFPDKTVQMASEQLSDRSDCRVITSFPFPGVPIYLKQSPVLQRTQLVASSPIDCDCPAPTVSRMALKWRPWADQPGVSPEIKRICGSLVLLNLQKCAQHSPVPSCVRYSLHHVAVVRIGTADLPVERSAFHAALIIRCKHTLLNWMQERLKCETFPSWRLSFTLCDKHI
jgi:hypothetical protein